jgi:hypothetical protein
LHAGCRRFRLPLVAALRRLARTVERRAAGGWARWCAAAGAELLPAVVEAARIAAVLVLTRAGRPVPCGRSCARCPSSYAARAGAEASRPASARGRAGAPVCGMLNGAEERVLDAGRLQLTGAPRSMPGA